MKIGIMDKTVKTFVYSEDGNSQKSNLADDKINSLELAMKVAQLEDEKSRSLEHLKTIVQLRENLKKEQEKNSDLSKTVTDLHGKLNKLSSVEDNQLVKKNTLLEEERKKTVEQLKVIDLLKENLKLEQHQNAELVTRVDDLQGKLNKLASVDAEQLFKKNAQLEDEKKKSGEYLKSINELVENLKIEQAKVAEMEKKIALQETKAKELAEVLSTISNIAAGV
jgi:NAD-dependent SIR2 family protein deacetylase